jgi:hypothetical protein
LLVHGSEQEVRDAVERVRNSLSRNNGGVIAQLSYELDTKFENVMAIYDQWQKLPQSRAR